MLDVTDILSTWYQSTYTLKGNLGYSANFQHMSYFEKFVCEINPENKPAPPENLMIRKAVINDADSLSKVVFEREGGSPEAIKARLDKELARIENSGDTLLLVAEHNQNIIGFGRARYFQPPEGSPPYCAPEGWYLLGLIISNEFRRRGIGRLLTERRLEWLKNRTDKVFYFVNKRNEVSIKLHQSFGFCEVTSDFIFPGALDQRGEGILFQLETPINQRSISSLKPEP
jgi:ribosomal protein S18 acetylase RimI-like enzyme